MVTVSSQEGKITVFAQPCHQQLFVTIRVYSTSLVFAFPLCPVAAIPWLSVPIRRYPNLEKATLHVTQRALQLNMCKVQRL